MHIRVIARTVFSWTRQGWILLFGLVCGCANNSQLVEEARPAPDRLGTPGTVELSRSVARPGRYPFDRGMTLTDLLGTAGGATPRSRLEDVRILRKDGGNAVMNRLEVNLLHILDGSERDLALRADDRIHVPERRD